jgi:hypothetical protein
MHAILDPVLRFLIARYGKEEARRRFAKAIEVAGFDPLEARLFFREDES